MSSLTNFSGRLILLAMAGIIAGCAQTSASVRGGEQGAAKGCIVVLPVENLSGTAAPLKEIRKSLVAKMAGQGMCIVDDNVTSGFMASHRMRNSGTIDKGLAQALKAETGATAVLMTSLQLYSDAVPPKTAFSCRLVSTGETPAIIGVESVALSGDDSPGIFGLGMVEQPAALMDKAMDSMTGAIAMLLAGERRPVAGSFTLLKYRPKTVYHSPSLDMEQKLTIAVVPFLNKSGRKSAGEMMASHFMEQFKKLEQHSVVEPGMIRQALLKYRIIMEDGISLASADLLFDDVEADLILTGEVMDYEDYQGANGSAKVDFSVKMLDRKSREVVWSSHSYNNGDDWVWFFQVGKVNTAEAMAMRMTRAVVAMMAINKE